MSLPSWPRTRPTVTIRFGKMPRANIWACDSTIASSTVMDRSTACRGEKADFMSFGSGRYVRATFSRGSGILVPPAWSMTRL